MFQIKKYQFLPRGASPCCRPVSVRPSVRLSVTFVYCIHTAEVIVKLLSQPGGPIILVFDPSAGTQCQGNPLSARKRCEIPCTVFYLFIFTYLFIMKIVCVHMTNKNETQETTRTTINQRNTQIANNEIYISGAQDGNISQIILNQQKIINNIS